MVDWYSEKHRKGSMKESWLARSSLPKRQRPKPQPSNVQPIFLSVTYSFYYKNLRAKDGSRYTVDVDNYYFSSNHSPPFSILSPIVGNPLTHKYLTHTRTHTCMHMCTDIWNYFLNNSTFHCRGLVKYSKKYSCPGWLSGYSHAV